MNHKDYFDAMSWIDSHDPTRKFPHGLLPGTTWLKHGPIDETARGRFQPSADAYSALQYNPPEYATDHFPDADMSANIRPMPTWEEVETAARESNLRRVRDVLPGALSLEAQRRITAAYGADSWEDEIQKRLRGATAPAQDTERDRLIAVYHAEIQRISTMTDDEILAYDPSDDAIWAPPA